MKLCGIDGGILLQNNNYPPYLWETVEELSSICNFLGCFKGLINVEGTIEHCLLNYLCNDRLKLKLLIDAPTTG